MGGSFSEKAESGYGGKDLGGWDWEERRKGKEARGEALPALALGWGGWGGVWSEGRCFSVPRVVLCSPCCAGSLFGRDNEATFLQG